MRRYLLRRIAWIIPSLLVISAIIFVLSKTLPGDAASQRLFSGEEMSGRDVDVAAQQRIYRQFLQRTGQAIPVFYVQAQSLAEPDTLHRVWPVAERDFLQRLVFQYGNWPLIAAYYQQIQQLRQRAQLHPDRRERQLVNQLVEKLMRTADRAEVQRSLTDANQALSPSWRQSIVGVRASFQRVVTQATPYKTYVPVIHWNGWNNQYHRWLQNALTGNLGVSYRDARPVTAAIAEAIGNTLLLSVISLAGVFAVALTGNLVLWTYATRKWHQRILRLLYVTDAVPLFLLALLLLILLASGDFLVLFPVYGLGEASRYGWLASIPIRLYHLTIPAICLLVASVPYVTIQLYQAVREVQSQEFVTTARAKGLAELRVVSKHMVRNALLPMITIFSDFLPALIAGTLVIEVIFAIPGAGSLLVDAIYARDYPVILGIALMVALAKMAGNVLADVLYYLTDPRIRFR